MHKYMKIVCLAIIVCIMPIAVHADVICFEGGSAESEKQTIEIKNSGGYMSVVTESGGNGVGAISAESSTSLTTPIEVYYSGHTENVKYRAGWRFKYVDGTRTDITLSSPNGRIGFVRTKADGGLQIASNYVAESASVIQNITSGLWYTIEVVFTPGEESGGTAVWYLNETEVARYSYTTAGVLSTIYVQTKGTSEQVASKTPVLYIDDIGVNVVRDLVIDVKPTRTGGIFTDNKEICFSAEVTGAENDEDFEGEATVSDEDGKVIWSGKLDFSDKSAQIKPRWEDGENQYGIFNLDLKVKSVGEDDYIRRRVPFSVIFSNGVINPKMGVSSHYVSGYETAYEDFDKEISLNVLAGFGINREEFEWNKYELSPGEYSLTNRQKKLFDTLKTNGLTPMPILYNGSWVYGRECGSAAEFMPMPVNDYQREKYAAYIKSAVEDVSEYAPVLEIGNEWNLNYWNKTHTWENGETVTLTVKEHYIPMMRAAYDAVKSVDENIQVIGIAAGAGSILSFVEECLENGAADYCDMISIHPYSILTSPEEQSIRSTVSEIRALLSKTSKPDMPIVFSEWGWTSAPGVLSEEQQAMYSVRGAAMVRDMTEYLIWYGAQEKDYVDDVYEQNFGMINYTAAENSLAAKPVYVAMSCHNSLTGDKQMTDLTVSSDGVYISEFSNEDESAVQFWTTGEDVNFSIAEQEGVALLYDMYGNRKAVMPQNGVYTLTAKEEPQYLVISDTFEIVLARIIADGEIVKTEITDEAQIELETIFSNGSDTDKPLSIILAAYDKDGQLVKASSEEITVAAGTYYESGVKPGFVKTAEMQSIRAFVWKDDYRPLIKSIDVYCE